MDVWLSDSQENGSGILHVYLKGLREISTEPGGDSGTSGDEFDRWSW